MKPGNVYLRERVPHRWLPVLGSLTVGVSLGLPLFLYMREAVSRDPV
jgi:hypothetical protein